MFRQVRIIEEVISPAFCVAHACNVDQYLSHDFNKNDAGWLRNDLSALAAAQTKEQYELILLRLKELPTISNLPKDVPLKDAFDFIKPRSMQTENEFADFVQFLTEKGLKAQEAAYAADFARKLNEEKEVKDFAPAPAPNGD